MLREDKTAKPDFTLIPYVSLVRLAQRFQMGAAKYQRDNYKEATKDELETFKKSALRHLLQYIDGQSDEDHISAAMCNIAIVMYLEDKL